jgi:hypothetical protein
MTSHETIRRVEPNQASGNRRSEKSVPLKGKNGLIVGIAMADAC